MKFVKVNLCLTILILSVHCQAENTTLTACEKWLASAVRDIESVPPPQRFTLALRQLTQSCEQAIPGKLRHAAADALKTRNHKQRFVILLKAASDYFPRICQEIDQEKPASYLVSVCKEDDDKDGIYKDLLPHLEASTYLYGKAIEKELKKDELKTVILATPENKLYIQKIMLNYFLGAQHDYKARQPKYYE
jgi:hypothetical protein